MFVRQPSCDFQSSLTQINDANSFTPFGFVLRKYPARIFEIDVPRFYVEQLLRPRATFPSRFQYIAKRFVADVIQNTQIFCLSDALLAPSGLRFFKVSQRIANDISHPKCPTEGPLDGNNAATNVAVRPARIGINPFLNVKWLKLVDRQIGNSGDEPLAPLQVPLIGSLSPVFLRPLKKRIDNRRNRLRLNSTFFRASHQLVKLLKRRFTVGTKIVTQPVDSDGFGVRAMTNLPTLVEEITKSRLKGLPAPC